MMAITAYSTSYAKNSKSSDLINFTPVDLNTQSPLYTLLLADIAINRGEYAFALNNYLKAAYLTKDAGVAEEATLLAIALEAPKQSLQAAELWANFDPQNLQAQLVVTTLYVSQSVEKTLPFLSRAISIDAKEVQQNITDLQMMLSEKGAINLGKATDLLAQQHPQNAQAHLIAALCASTLGEMDKATVWVDSALTLLPAFTAAIELKARIIRYQDNSDANALQYIQKNIEQYPKDTELRFFYANALLDTDQSAAAKKQFDQLLKNPEFGGPSFILLSEIAFDAGDLDQALENLKKALGFSNTKDSAGYLLGQFEEQLGNVKEAIYWYQNIGTGPYHVPAMLRAVALLKVTQDYDQALSLIHSSSPTTLEEQKELYMAEIDLLNLQSKSDKALELANDLLEKLPGDPDFLIMRALTAVHLNKLNTAEADLKIVLQENPGNANALSIMGYVLSLNDARLKEAVSYLKQALALSPNNPLFMDTMGWAYYRMGDLKNAQTYLEQANDLVEDSEIAAHLGEVLWMNNDKKQALSVWKKALNYNEQSEALLQTLNRFQVNVKSL